MPKKIDRRARKKLIARRMWRAREAELRGEGWYHAFGGEVPDMAVDAEGVSGPAWQSAVFGPSAFPADSVGPEPGATETIREKVFPGHKGAPLHYLGSWTHYPSVDEVDAVTPPEYRASEGARTEPIPAPGESTDA